jgi:hypothetical protein
VVEAVEVTQHAVLLGALVGRIERLEIHCSRCYRAGRVKLPKLTAERGPDLPMPQLAVRLAVDCPKINAINTADRCFAVFPQLVALATIPRPAGK